MTWKLTMIGLCAALISTPAIAAEVNLSLSCDRTTENGFDELFVVVAGKTSSGHDIVERTPGDRNVIRMGAGSLHELSLGDIDLSEGETVRLVVALFEDDDGPGAPWQTLASSMLASIPASLADVPPLLMNSFLAIEDFRPRHDFIGSFTVTVTMVEGKPIATFDAIDSSESVPQEDKSMHGFRLFGDGANYSVAASVANAHK